MISVKFAAVAAALSLGFLPVGTLPSRAQGPDTPEYQCLDRCWAGFEQCMAVDPNCTPEANCVPTPPPYEFCLAEKQSCEAQCTLARVPKPTTNAN